MDERTPRRFYGRRKGHRLSARRQRLVDDLLPVLRLDCSRPPPDGLEQLFAARVSEVWLEIGFGAGEHLAWQARENPRVGLIGSELFVNGIASLLAAVEDNLLETVRIFDEDGRDLLAWLPAGSIGRAFVLFPDPWPKNRHHRRRLLSVETLTALARAMRSGAELRVASDIGDCVRAVLEAVKAVPEFEWSATEPGQWRRRPSDWPETRYEARAIRDGRKPYYLQFLRA